MSYAIGRKYERGGPTWFWRRGKGWTKSANLATRFRSSRDALTTENRIRGQYGYNITLRVVKLVKVNALFTEGEAIGGWGDYDTPAPQDAYRT